MITNSSPGVLQPPPAPRGYEMFTKKVCAKLGVPVIAVHRAILTRPLNGRAACFYATPCGRGCSIRANFQTPTVLLPPAAATGNLAVITNAMVREVTLDKAGLANGVNYIDKTTGRDEHASARVVVLAASACESARILLNSRSNLFPDGLGNSSGLVGKYLMDSVGASLGGQIPALENVPPHNEDGVSGLHTYMPWWLYQQQARGELDFPRGYHVEYHGGRMMPEMGTLAGLEHYTGGSYGRKLKEDARRYYGSFIGFAGRGEMIPNADSYCELDPNARDKWGIPVLRFHFKWSEHELRQAAHMHRTFAEIITAMGGTVRGNVETDGSKAIAPPGSIIHEVGTTRMGFTNTDSVLNSYGQAWDVKNLFVTDGGPFVSNADKNPTLTIMALAWRASDYLVDQLNRGDL